MAEPALAAGSEGREAMILYPVIHIFRGESFLAGYLVKQIRNIFGHTAPKRRRQIRLQRCQIQGYFLWPWMSCTLGRGVSQYPDHHGERPYFHRHIQMLEKFLNTLFNCIRPNTPEDDKTGTYRSYDVAAYQLMELISVRKSVTVTGEG